MLAGIGWATFLLFGALNFVAIPFVWALYPETMNKTLEELDVIFSTRSLLVWNAEKELRDKGIDPNDPLRNIEDVTGIHISKAHATSGDEEKQAEKHETDEAATSEKQKIETKHE